MGLVGNHLSLEFSPLVRGKRLHLITYPWIKGWVIF